MGGGVGGGFPQPFVFGEGFFTPYFLYSMVKPVFTQASNLKLPLKVLSFTNAFKGFVSVIKMHTFDIVVKNSFSTMRSQKGMVR